MYLKLFKNDFKKNPWNNIILFLFMSFSVILAVSVCLMLTQLFASIQTMYETAKPSHFLQMHKGELIQEDIDEFNRNYQEVEHWQTVSMIDLYGDELTVFPAEAESEKSYTLADCRIDISLVKQNEKYDVLLDEERNKLEVHTGEIGVPVILLEQYKIGIGDTIRLESGGVQKEFVVSSYVYDGQMNSTLCSSTRFLISDRDFDELFGRVGETEYLIEAYFNDTSQAAAYQTAYEQSEKNLPKDGQAVNYAAIFLISAMSDIMLAMVFLLIGILLIAVALICLRYTILAELEDDMKEIGTMKAFGIPGNRIRNLYLGKIRILMVSGCICGFLISLLLVKILTGHMVRTFGEQQMSAGTLLLAVLVCVAVYGIVIVFSKRILRKIQKASVMDLLVTAKGFDRDKRTVKDGIHKAKRLPLNILLGLHEVRHGYGIIFGLLLIVSFLMLVPYRVVQTMEQEEFITYMGSPVCDVLLEVEQGAGLEERKSAAESLLLREAEQGTVAGFEILKRVRLQVVGSDGDLMGVHIDSGECAGRELKYLAGSKPENEGELVLSTMLADELGKTVGDTVEVITSEGKQVFILSGIYQDVTSGSRTAETICEFAGETAELYTFQVMLSQEEGMKEELQQIEKWREQLGNGYSIENMEEFLGQTIGGVAAQVRKGAVAAVFIGIFLTVLIVLLFLKLRIARENVTLAAKRAMGIPFAAIVKQELYPVMIAGGLGTVSGVFLAEVFGDTLVSMLLGMMEVGLKRIEFANLTVLQQLIVPTILVVTLTIVTIISCRQIRRLDVADNING